MSLPPLQAAMRKLPKYMRDTDDGKRQLTEFAAAVREAALEEAAKVCDAQGTPGYYLTAEKCAAAIRALKNAPDR